MDQYLLTLPNSMFLPFQKIEKLTALWKNTQETGDDCSFQKKKC